MALTALYGPAFAWSEEDQLDWTVAIYAAIDEEEIDQYAEPLIREILNLPLGVNTELFLEKDGYQDKHVYRYYRQGSEPRTRYAKPEHDSASPKALEGFLRWVDKHSTGKRRLVIIMTHAWGWKGIIQDYTLPDGADDTMMPVDQFAAILQKSARPVDVLFLDSCVLGNVEPIDEMARAAHYLIASQRETPYAGYPYQKLFEMLSQGASPLEVARRVPHQYVEAFARGGSRVENEGEHFALGVFSVDLKKWDAFAELFANFTSSLSDAGFRDFLDAKLSDDAHWATRLTDTDHNADLVNLLSQISSFGSDSNVAWHAQALLDMIGYPSDVAEKSAETLTFEPTQTDLVKIAIPIDEFLDSKKVLSEMTKRWKDVNRDFSAPSGQRFQATATHFEVITPVTRTFKVRPWLSGVRRARVATRGLEVGDFTEKTLERESDFFSVDRFPESSFMVAEAHTTGAPFVHGVGIGFHPLMDDTEERAVDWRTGAKGPTYYRSTKWNQRTGWGELILLND